jgi:hypothetical protein
MSTSTTEIRKTQAAFEARVLQEGYGPGAWHGADLKAALTDVTAALAYWRPSSGRHNIAEIALHHAYCVRAVAAQVSGREATPFVLPGEDWFDLADQTAISWERVNATVETEQRRLSGILSEIEAGRTTSPMEDEARFGLVLGITCHAIYHAGQIQLLKRLHGD